MIGGFFVAAGTLFIVTADGNIGEIIYGLAMVGVHPVATLGTLTGVLTLRMHCWHEKEESPDSSFQCLIFLAVPFKSTSIAAASLKPPSDSSFKSFAVALTTRSVFATFAFFKTPLRALLKHALYTAAKKLFRVRFLRVLTGHLLWLLDIY